MIVSVSPNPEMVPPKEQMTVAPRELRRWRRRLPLSEEEIKEHHATFAHSFPAGVLSRRYQIYRNKLALG